ncbi:hypothetical protein C8P63_103208 [Melghirimyces profundicolus]|uniref:Uncharacterized protein n=1 Tax=Melghirimyces profundicolus TaxID=1242148 RepID=A0A2T6C7Z9_9BACL|nr:hypothetical protein [Melghirimyces profundicolus]PTX64422.1 hypothetical protein C8P63_103208 [Melghirimyces profundicolus]
MKKTLFLLGILPLLYFVAACSDDPKTAMEPATDSKPAAKKKEPPKLAEIHQPETHGPAGAVYDIQATYAPQKHRIEGTLSVRFRNNTGETLQDLHFNR